jgi:hypothetical protein
MKLVGSHSSKSSPFMMKVMTLYFVSDTRNDCTHSCLVCFGLASTDSSFSECCCGVFSAIS